MRLRGAPQQGRSDTTGGPFGRTVEAVRPSPPGIAGGLGGLGVGAWRQIRSASGKTWLGLPRDPLGWCALRLHHHRAALLGRVVVRVPGPRL